MMKILHLDIETAPNLVYAWGLYKQDVSISQIVDPGYTLCYAAKWHGDRTIHTANVKDDGGEGLVKTLWALLNEADVVVHYNGTKFDIPTINKEFLLLGLPPPAPYQQIDLLKTVRKQFRFASNKLDFVCQQLGIGAKVQHKGMELWSQCMQGNEKAWREMLRYNKQDVRLLGKLYLKLLPWIDNHPNVVLYEPLVENREGLHCPNCGGDELERRGFAYTKVSKFQRYRCTDCGKWSRVRKKECTNDQPYLV